MTPDQKEFLLSILKIVRWPSAFVLVILFFLKPLGLWIGRWRSLKGGKWGIEAAGSQAGATEAGKPQASDLLKVFDNALVVQNEEAIWRHLKKVEGGPERERVVVRFLSAAQLALSFEKTYNLIWGSQIAALEFLNTVSTAGAEILSLQPFYEEAKAADPMRYATYTFDQWIGFLHWAQLIVRSENHVVVTPAGREFLKYLVSEGHPLVKLG